MEGKKRNLCTKVVTEAVEVSRKKKTNEESRRKIAPPPNPISFLLSTPRNMKTNNTEYNYRDKSIKRKTHIHARFPTEI